ncbi:MAG: DUF3168 domain-containing protein [Caldilineaceae bacterium]|nr:DUF3168 domain-containing protein [Caldilineaceae bacterium]
MIDHAAMGSAVYSALSGGTVSVYDTMADQGGTPPYAIVQLQAAVADYSFTDDRMAADYTVKVVSNRRWPGEARLVYGHLHNLMQDAALSVTGYTLIRCRRRSLVEYRDSDDYWHSGGIYAVEFIAT